MDYKRTMYLISLLHSAADEKKKARLGELFKQSVTASSGYQELKKLLQSLTFFGRDGADLHDESEKRLHDAVVDIGGAEQNIHDIDRLVGLINHELKRSQQLVSSPGFFDEELTVLDSSAADGYNAFYRACANCICYYLVTHFGTRAIRNLTFNHGAGFQDVMRLVNQRYADELLASTQYDHPQTWFVEKRHFRDDNPIDYYGYVIEYANRNVTYEMIQEMGEIASKRLSREISYSRIAPFLYSSSDQVVYIGSGNVVGVEPKNGLALLESDIVTTLPPDALDNVDFEPNDLIGALTRALNTDCFCISPEDIVAALNHRNLVRTVKERRERKECIFCGRRNYDGHACESHIRITA